MEEVTIYTDGASRGNPGPASYGFTIRDASGNLVFEEGKVLGINTNNFAEYSGVLEAFKYLVEKFPSERINVTLKADSRLVVMQLAGKYKIKAENLKPLVSQIRLLEMQLGKIRYVHVPRELNKQADLLANLALNENP
jgi:ribonuclease HI